VGRLVRLLPASVHRVRDDDEARSELAKGGVS
jgi:hypothetical protein